MSLLRPQPPQYLVSVSEAEADAGRKALAEAMRPPVLPSIAEHPDDAASMFAKLQGVVDAAREQRRKGESKEGP